jgi:predicted DNA-binding WGR domain protein
VTHIELRRIDAAHNMRRFYRLDIEPDLFGGFLLMKQWGRIGVRGQIKADRYESEPLAAATLEKQAACRNLPGRGDARLCRDGGRDHARDRARPSRLLRRHTDGRSTFRANFSACLSDDLPATP